MDNMNNIYNPLQPNSPYSIFTSAYNSMGNVSSAPHVEIIKVNGKNGAEKYAMGPNSSALLLDMNDPLIWFVSTDGAGYKTCLPYSITPYQPPQELDIKTILNQLNTRLTNIEERMGNNNESNNGTFKQSSQQSTEFNIH